MKLKITSSLILGLTCSFFFNLHAQTENADYYNVVAGNGKGLRFWSNNTYKIHMGNSSEYKYGPVQDYSIKMNMNNDSDRGWTWGVSGATPIAALSTGGVMKLKGSFTSESSIRTNSFRTLTDDWEIFRSGEDLQIREPEQTNKVWATFKDDQGLHLSGTPNLWVDGQIGVGTTSPTASLHVKSYWPQRSSIKLEYSSETAPEGDTGWMTWEIVASSVLHFKYLESTAFFIEGNGNALFNGNVNAKKFTGSEFKISGSEDKFLVKNNGHVYARQIEVKSSGDFPDYVFKENYNLRPIEEVENFINSNGHLPEVPTAEEVEENGHNLEEMDKILLKKVEELTLYMIDLKKENDALKAEIIKIKEQR